MAASFTPLYSEPSPIAVHAPVHFGLNCYTDSMDDGCPLSAKMTVSRGSKMHCHVSVTTSDEHEPNSVDDPRILIVPECRFLSSEYDDALEFTFVKDK